MPAEPQRLVYILRQKGLKSLKFGSVHWPKSWLCSVSTGLAQNNLTASWPSTFLLYQPGLDSGSISAKLDQVRATNQSISPPKSDCSKSPPRIQHRLVAQFPPRFCPFFFIFSTSCFLSPFPLHPPDVCPCFRLRAALRNASTALKSFLDSKASRCRPAHHLELV